MIEASVQICTAGWQCTQAVPVDLDFPELLSGVRVSFIDRVNLRSRGTAK